MGAVPSELGEFFSCREGQHSTVIHRVRYPQIRANTTTLETQWGGFEKIVHSCGEQLLMKRPLKIQFENQLVVAAYDEVMAVICCTEMHSMINTKKGYRRLGVNLSFYTGGYILWPKQTNE